MDAKSGRARWLSQLVRLVEGVGWLHAALLAFVSAQVLCSGVYALTSRLQTRTAWLLTLTCPLGVSLFGLATRRYWAWVLALAASGYNLVCLVGALCAGTYSHAFYARMLEDRPLVWVYVVVGSHVLSLLVLALLVVERDEFD